MRSNYCRAGSPKGCQPLFGHVFGAKRSPRNHFGAGGHVKRGKLRALQFIARTTKMPLVVGLTLLFLAAARAQDTNSPPPREWIEPKTGHRVIRLSPDTGGSSLYFHQHTYTPEGDKIIIDTQEGLGTVDLTKLGTEPPRFELVAPVFTRSQRRGARAKLIFDGAISSSPSTSIPGPSAKL